MGLAERTDPFDVGRHAEEMMHDDAERVVVEHRLDLRWIEIERRRTDVADRRHQTGAENRRRHGVTGVRRHDDARSRGT